MKDEYDFHKIKDAFDKTKVPPQLEFFYGGDNDIFYLPVICSNLPAGTQRLADVL